MKIQKIKTTGLRTAGKIILWALVIFLILCGTKSILSASNEDQLKEIIRDYQESTQLREETRTGATAFAESFIYEYYTYTGQLNSDYAERVGAYFASGVDIKNVNATATAAETVSAQTVNISFISDTQMDVDIWAKVKYTSLMGESAGKITEQDVYLRVPVIAENMKLGKGGNYAVGSLPMIIPSYEKAKVENFKGYPGTEIPKESKDEIKIVLESFFKAYYEGTDSEVSYYVTDSSNIKKSLSGMFVFHRIEQMSIVQDKSISTSEYLAEVDLTVLDHGQPIAQRMFLTIEKVKKKYYIKKIATSTF